MADNNLTPPEGVQSSAKRALKWIADGKAGGGFTSVGHTRATQLANGESISFSTMKRMKSFFSRHEVDKQAEGFNEGEKGFPSPGRVAWDAWGGNAGFAWVKAKVSEVENSMNKSVDIAPLLIELGTDKLISLHERLHKNVFSPANLEVHHLTTSEMFRRGIKMPIDDEWQDVRLEIDYIEDADLESFGTALPQVLVEDVIKTTGTNIGDVRLILTPFGYAMEIATVEKFNPNHDQVGRFSTGSGGSSGSSDNSANSSGGSKFNNLADDLIAGKPAHIDVKDVGKFLETMAQRGDNPDITKLQVNGHTLFGGEGLGIKRKDMPQIPMEMRKQFIQDMADKGISTELKKVNAMDLKPSQSEISATKTARLYEHFKKDGIPTDKAILVSKDGFVVDGHHHWAAAAAMGLMGKNSKIPVIVMDTNIKDALTRAKSWSESHGILAQDLNSAEIPFKKLSNESDYFLKFNPNHDELGRFATGSGGGNAGIPDGVDSKNALKPEAERRGAALVSGRTPGLPRDAEGRVINPDATGGYKAGIPEVVSFAGHDFTPADSLWHHLVPDGRGGYEISQERALLHAQIVAEATGNVPVSSNPTFHMLGGGPASGKTSAIKAGFVEVPGPDKAVHINADDAKAALPENRRMSQSKNDGDFFSAAAFAHEESSILAKQIQKKAIANGQDIVLDGTGDSSIEKLSAKVEEARQAGYKVNGVYVTIATDSAWSRAVKRALGPEKRFVPESVVRTTHRDVSVTFPKAIAGHLFDRVTLIESHDGGNPTLIGSGNRKTFTIADQAAYDTFLAKGDEK